MVRCKAQKKFKAGAYYPVREGLNILKRRSGSPFRDGLATERRT